MFPTCVPRVATLEEMAVTTSPTLAATKIPPRSALPLRTHLALLLMTAGMLLVHGYHPLSEDGGLYVAGIQYSLDPGLFPHDTAFVTAHLHYSMFAPLMVLLVRATRLPLEWVLLPVYLFSLWLTLFAGLAVLRRTIASPAAQFAGVALLAAWATLPVAGTALTMLDPYLTARSLSTPLSLLAIAFALDFKSSLTLPASSVACVAVAALLHPLMAAYALALVVALWLLSVRRPLWSCIGAASAVILTVAVIQRYTPAEQPAVVAAAISRYYWFLSQWHWYELAGLLGPLGIFALLLRSKKITRGARTLCYAALFTGGVAILISLLFAHESSPAHLIARLQPLRIFLPIYALMALLLGARLFEELQAVTPRAAVPIAAVVLALNAGILFYAQRQIYPASQPIEMPGAAARNPWSQAFVWARDNTPRDALFALDADYITRDGEDAQSFRATAMRSALPDFSKDGGEAAITPSLAELWQQGVAAQRGLSAATDAQRETQLRPFGVSWEVLRSNAITARRCPYNNGTVKVCQATP